MLNDSVATALDTFGGMETEETAKFARMFNHFFDCLNVTNYSARMKERNPFKAPYRGPTDFRLKVCTRAEVTPNNYIPVY